jgi:hypothetical protein
MKEKVEVAEAGRWRTGRHEPSTPKEARLREVELKEIVAMTESYPRIRTIHVNWFVDDGLTSRKSVRAHENYLQYRTYLRRAAYWQLATAAGLRLINGHAEKHRRVWVESRVCGATVTGLRVVARVAQVKNGDKHVIRWSIDIDRQ